MHNDLKTAKKKYMNEITTLTKFESMKDLDIAREIAKDNHGKHFVN